MNRRQLALTIFSEWRKDKIFIDHLFETYIYKQTIEENDKNWIQFLVYGTIEHFFAIDFILKKITHNKFNKNKQLIRNILYLATYELLFSSNKPYAIIDESVKLTKQNKKIYESKIVNGVLREISSKKDELLSEIKNSKDIQIKYNVSNELHQLLLNEFDEKLLITWYSTFSEINSIWLRYNTLKSDNETRFVESDSFDLIKTDLEAGNLSVQDISAGRVIEYMNPKPNTTILDYCSAPGGKTCYIAEFTNDKAIITATDIDEFRLKKVTQNIDRLGISSIDLKPIESISETFDQVLLDIPCSGIGVLSKRSDMSVLFNPENLTELEDLQHSIMEKACKHVKIGGELIVSTCTILIRENMGLVKSFLANHPEFSQIEEPLVCLPFDGKQDGSFAIKLKKETL